MNLWEYKSFREWLIKKGKNDVAVLTFASKYHLKKLLHEFYSEDVNHK